MHVEQGLQHSIIFPLSGLEQEPNTFENCEQHFPSEDSMEHPLVDSFSIGAPVHCPIEQLPEKVTCVSTHSSIPHSLVIGLPPSDPESNPELKAPPDMPLVQSFYEKLVNPLACSDEVKAYKPGAVASLIEKYDQKPKLWTRRSPTRAQLLRQLPRPSSRPSLVSRREWDAVRAREPEVPLVPWVRRR